MNKKVCNIISVFILGMAVLWSFSVQAQMGKYIEGVHYVAIDNPVILENKKSEVLEVFWYGCGHCYAFEPLLDAWQKSKSDAVNFVRSPVTWDDATKQHAQLYFVAESLGITSEIHNKIFDEIHQENNYLFDKQSALAFFMGLGVDGNEFDRSYESFTVDSKIRKAESLQHGLGVTSVPTMIVNSRYRVSVNSVVTNHEDVLKVVDYLLTL